MDAPLSASPLRFVYDQDTAHQLAAQAKVFPDAWTTGAGSAASVPVELSDSPVKAVEASPKIPAAEFCAGVFMPGDEVIFEKASMRGKRGVLLYWHHEKGRWVIQLIGISSANRRRFGCVHGSSRMCARCATRSWSTIRAARRLSRASPRPPRARPKRSCRRAAHPR